MATTPSTPVPEKWPFSQRRLGSPWGRWSSSSLGQAVRAQEVSVRVIQDLGPRAHLSGRGNERSM